MASTSSWCGGCFRGPVLEQDSACCAFCPAHPPAQPSPTSVLQANYVNNVLGMKQEITPVTIAKRVVQGAAPPVALSTWPRGGSRGQPGLTSQVTQGSEEAVEAWDTHGRTWLAKAFGRQAGMYSCSHTAGAWDRSQGHWQGLSKGTHLPLNDQGCHSLSQPLTQPSHPPSHPSSSQGADSIQDRAEETCLVVGELGCGNGTWIGRDGPLTSATLGWAKQEHGWHGASKSPYGFQEVPSVLWTGSRGGRGAHGHNRACQKPLLTSRPG